MKKILATLLALVMILSLAACGGKKDDGGSAPADPGTSGPSEPAGGEEEKDYSKYTIRIYSNSNSTERTT